MAEDDPLASFAAAHSADLAAVRALVGWLSKQAGGEQFYIFWSPRGAGGRGAARVRMLVAFPSPDSALGFAQRNGLAGASAQPRLRRLTLLQLLHAMLNEPSIGTLVLADEQAELPAQAGYLPNGLRLTRAELLTRLQAI